MENKAVKNAPQQMLIETPQLIIKGNIMIWHETMIHLTNVSCISTRPLPATMFPIFSLIFLVAGAISLSIHLNIAISLILLSIGGVWIYNWYLVNKDRKMNTILNIIMNSGSCFQIVFNDKDFLGKVLTVLEQIIIDGGVGQQDVFININGCTISGNANVLSDFKLS